MRVNAIKTISTRYGTFAIDQTRDKKMAEALEHREYFNEGLLTVARQFVNEKSTVIDIGAHIGTFAVPIAAEVEKVIAFEPSPEAFSLLSRNAKENAVPIQLVNKALGSEKGRGTLVVRNASNAGANTLVTGGDILVTTLDDEAERADFIKIDVEGMELEVLRGGVALIERSRPAIIFEVNLSQLRAHGTSVRALEQFFTEYNYRLYFPLEDESLVFADIESATLLTALIAPRAWLFFGTSAPFDLVAIPRERSLPRANFLKAITYVISENIAIKYKRISLFFQSIF